LSYGAAAPPSEHGLRLDLRRDRWS